MPSRSNFRPGPCWDVALNRSYKPVKHYFALNRRSTRPKPNNELTDGEKAYLEQNGEDNE